MDSRMSRWTCLTLFAVANLVFWLGVAVAVGLVVSDGVDLGVETFIREGQATAVAFWKQVSARSTQNAANPTAIVPTRPNVTASPRVNATDTLTWPSTPTLVPTQQAEPKETGNDTGANPSLPATRQPQATQTSTGSSEAQASAAPPAQPTAWPSSTPIRSPLLMSDPDLTSLFNLYAEMGRSAVGRPVQIRYHEGPLNEQISRLLADNPDLPYRDVQVDLNRDEVILTGKVTVVGFEVDTEVTGQLMAESCQPQVAVEEIRVAGLVTPGFVREGIKEIVLDALDWYPSDYPLCMEQIVLEEGRLTVYGSRR